MKLADCGDQLGEELRGGAVAPALGITLVERRVLKEHRDDQIGPGARELGSDDAAERMPDDESGTPDLGLDQCRNVGRVALGVVGLERGAARFPVTAQVDVPDVTIQMAHDRAVREPAARQPVEEDGRGRLRVAEAIDSERLAGCQRGEHRSERYDQRVIRDDLAAAVRASLTSLGVEPPAEIVLERPRVAEHGDWSTNVALATAKGVGRNPRELAAELADHLNAADLPHVAKVEIAGPGFVNFRLHDTWLHEVLRDVIAGGVDDYARPDLGHGERVMIEFVSANPTGPLHVGNGWFASYGDALARLFARTGHVVSREYYVNDTGGQVRKFGASILARKHGQPVPEDGYPGEYVADLAVRYDGSDDLVEAGRWAGEHVLADIRETLESINIEFDEWYSQASIEESGAVAEAIEELRAKGLIFDREGATWLRTEDFGDPRKERVLIKSNGDVTYLGGDIAYHRDKFFVRGYDRVIDVWGADHQAQVPSLIAAMEALGVERGKLEVKIGQMVSLASGRMSKRLGNTVDLSELINDIGPDATRLLTLLSSVDAAPTIDLDIIREQSRENPVYYVQYAHARIASIHRVAAERGVERMPLVDVDIALLVHDRELDILRTLVELPDVMVAALEERAPHKVTTWVRELADRFHGFYHDCYVMGEGVSPALTQARLWLVEAVRIGLAIGLDVLGVHAPDSM